MGLAFNDPHGHKVQTKLYKITKFGVNIQRNVWPSGHCPKTASAWPYISLLILTLLNHCTSVKTSLINTKLGNFVNLGVLFLTMWINSCLMTKFTDSYLVPFDLKLGNNSNI